MEKYLSSGKTALLVIDMQNDYCHENGAMATNGLGDQNAFQECVPRIVSVIEKAREANIPIIYIYMTMDESTTSEAWINHFGADVNIGVKGTWGAELYEAIKPQVGEYVVEKNRYSAFINTNLEVILKTLKIDSLVLTGVVTNVCVESTARDAFMMDYNVTVIEDGCAGTNPTWHKASLDHMRFGFAQVIPASEVIEYWSGRKKIINN